MTNVGDFVGNFVGDVVNVITTHRAGKSVADLGLNNVGGRWAGIDSISSESTAQPGIFILGDSTGTSQPKSGHMAISQAKVCADAIVRTIAGSMIDSAQRLDHLRTNSACYSPITYDKCS